MLKQLEEKLDSALADTATLQKGGGNEQTNSKRFKPNPRRDEGRNPPTFKWDSTLPDTAQPPHCPHSAPSLYKQRLKLRSGLPAYRLGQAFVKAVCESDVVVLCGETGSGKTTQLPQLLMEHVNGFNTSDRQQCRTGRKASFICTQPRRISATSVAERVSFERGEGVGERVGFQIRFEKQSSASTELLYCTIGILLRVLIGNPTLDGIDCVIIDEVHERGLQTDFLLLLLRDLAKNRKARHARGEAGVYPLKLVLMSATIDASQFLHYFGGAEGAVVQHIEIEGKTNFPIEEFFAEDILGRLLKEDTHFRVGPPVRSGDREQRVDMPFIKDRLETLNKEEKRSVVVAHAAPPPLSLSLSLSPPSPVQCYHNPPM